MNFLHFTDIHVARSASYRVDDIMVALRSKFVQIRAYIEQYDVKACFISGDIFNSNSGAKIPHDIVAEFTEMLQLLKVPIYAIAGNHDLYLNDINSHPLRTLFQTGVLIRVTEQPVNISKGIYLCGFEHRYEKDSNRFEKPLIVTARPPARNVLIGLTHLVLGEKPGMFYSEEMYGIEEFTSSNVDLFLNGHIHTPLGPLVNSKGQIFCQPGALRRTNTASEEMDRVPQVTLIRIDETYASPIKVSYLPIECRKDIFKDWKKKIVDEKKEEMNGFIERVQSIRTSNQVDINQIIRDSDLDAETRAILEHYINS